MICTISMMAMIGTAIVSPALPTIQKALNVEAGSIGLVMAVFTFPGIILIPLTAVLADRFGRKTVIVPLLFLYGLAGGLSFLAPDFETLLVMRFLSGMGASSLGSLTLVLVGDKFGAKERSTVFGYRLAFGQVANGVIPPIAGLLAIIGWQYPFLLYFLAVPVGLFVLFAMEADVPRQRTSLGRYLTQTWRGLRNPRMLGLMSVILTLTMVNHGINLTFLPIFMAESFHASAVIIGLVLSVRVVVGAALAAIMGRLTALFREERLLMIALASLLASLLWLPLTDGIWEMVGPAVLAGVSTGLGFPAFQSLLVREAPADVRAGVMAANSVIGRLGQTLGPIMAGTLFAAGGADMLFYGGALFVAVMSVLLFLALRWRPGADDG